MTEHGKLTLEVLSGPLDGAVITLEAETAWSRTGDGQLSFPWDEELGNPQARFIPDEQGWLLEALQAAHGTYRATTGEKLQGKVRLSKGDVLKASQVWLLLK